LCRYAWDGLSLKDVRDRAPGPWRYRELLPLDGDPVSLGEPQTALLPLTRLSERWGVETYIKDDQTLAGGTFKARGASVGLSRAVELGVTDVVMPSAGNAGGAWSLYAARAGASITVTMAKTAPLANQAEVRTAGGKLVLVDGSIADAGAKARAIAEETGAYLAATFAEPYRLEGKKTAWLEIFDQLGDESVMRFPGSIVMPVGGGVAAIAARKASKEIASLGWARGEKPRIFGVQAERCAPIARAFESGSTEVAPWKGDPMTIAAGLRVPAPSEGDLVLERVRGSKGAVMAVSEDEIRSAIARLASSEGVFACPEGAAAVAAAEHLAHAGALKPPVVLYNTGAGAKYADVLE
jgi:threonine synthase